MKKLILALLLVMPLSGCCSLFCVPKEASITAKENAEISDAFKVFMDAERTTRKQEQDFIRAGRRAWHAQNFALNDAPLPADVETWHAKRKLGGAAPAPAPPPEPTRLLPR